MSSAQDEIATARAQALDTAREAFAKLDIDGNGQVEKDELRQFSMQAEIGGGAIDADDREKKIAEFFATFDTDGDGKVSLDEWLNFFGHLFDTVVQQTLAGQE